mmetsp:Transcript_4820/g.17036  ORF Transcript_4820/g.17036 Transcript_4820/m.17036 type:complete len:251 (-) Transcript_4820:1176-1928(-)
MAVQRPRDEDQRRGGGPGAAEQQRGTSGPGGGLQRGLSLEVNLIRPHAGGDEDVRGGRHQHVGLPLPDAAGPVRRNRAADYSCQHPQAHLLPWPAGAEPFAGLRCASGAAEPHHAHPGPARYGQDGHLCVDCLPPRSPEAGPGASLRAEQRGRRPADGEDRQDRPPRRAPLRQEQRGYQLPCGVPHPPLPGAPPRLWTKEQRTAQALPAQGGSRRAFVVGREEVQVAEELCRARDPPQCTGHLLHLRRRW